MKDTTIEWADHSWSPWIGCTKVSPGCANCYAEHLMDHRMKKVNWGRGNPRKRTSAGYWKQPVKWDQIALMETGDPELYQASVFPSLCDWLDPEVPIEWLADFLALIHATPNLRWLLLTKRPELWWGRMRSAFAFLYAREGGADTCGMMDRWMGINPPPNVAIGVSCEDQQRWDERAPLLLQIPARWRFVSCEPLLSAIDMRLGRPSGVPAWWQGKLNPLSGLSQVIWGGESGPGARPCNVDWIRDGVRQCRDASVACFVKQLGSNSYVPAPFGPLTGKGNDMSQWPTDLRIREALA
jgi:protein gp37